MKKLTFGKVYELASELGMVLIQKAGYLELYVTMDERYLECTLERMYEKLVELRDIQQ